MSDIKYQIIEKININVLLKEFSVPQLALTFNVSSNHIKRLRDAQQLIKYGDAYRYYDRELKNVVEKVCDYFNITPKQIRAKSKVSEYVEPRKIAYFILYQKLGMSPNLVATFFHKTHGTVIVSSGKVFDRMTVDYKYKEKVEKILTLLKI